MNEINIESKDNRIANDKEVSSSDLLYFSYDNFGDRLLYTPLSKLEKSICYSFLGFTCLAMVLGFSLIAITIFMKGK